MARIMHVDVSYILNRHTEKVFTVGACFAQLGPATNGQCNDVTCLSILFLNSELYHI